MDDTQRAQRLLRYFSVGHRRLELGQRTRELRMRCVRAQERELALRLQAAETRVAETTGAAALQWRGCALDRMRADARMLGEQQRRLRAELLAAAHDLARSEGRLKGAQKLLADAMARRDRRLDRIEQAEIDQRASMPPTGQRRRT